VPTSQLIWIAAYRMVAAAPIEGYDERVLFGDDKSELLDSVLGPLIPGLPIKRQDANLTMVGFGPIIMASITMQVRSVMDKRRRLSVTRLLVRRYCGHMP